MAYKQAIVLRNDLEMGKGKLVAQGCHASLEAYRKASSKMKDGWEKEGMKKIVLKVGGEKELLEYFEKCRDEGIPCGLIRDAGHTQLSPGTITCFGAGPAKEERLDRVLGKLKLL